jgi:rhodanese-related sulfurtransferase
MDLPDEVTPLEAHAALAGEGAFLLDVREPWEWRERRIPGAVLIPLVELPTRLSELPAGTDIYVHCRAGRRSRRAVDYLRASGRPGAVNISGGIDAWAAAGLPLAEAPPP